jgi:hypothetical protein
MSMNPRTTFLLATTTLVVGSLLAIGIRHAADVEREGNAGSAALHPTDGPPSSLSAFRPGDRSGPVASSIQSQETMLKQLRKVLLTGDELDRARAILAMIDHLQPAEFPMALEALRRLRMSPNGYNEIAPQLLAAWAALDAPAAIAWEMKWVDNRGLGDNTDNAVNALGAWIRRDPAAAEAWIHAQPDERFSHLLGFVLSRMKESDNQSFTTLLARQDPAQTYASILDLPAAESEARLRQASIAIATRGPEALRKWLDVIADPGQRNQAILSVLNTQEGIPPSDRLALFQQHPELADKVSSSLYVNWINRDETAGLAALENLPTGTYREETIKAVIRNLPRPSAAVQLMDRYPEAATDRVVATWVDSVVNADDPKPWDLFLAQFHRIQDPALREEKYRSFFNNWLLQDPTGARDYLSHHDEIPAAVRHDLETR